MPVKGSLVGKAGFYPPHDTVPLSFCRRKRVNLMVINGSGVEIKGGLADFWGERKHLTPVLVYKRPSKAGRLPSAAYLDATSSIEDETRSKEIRHRG
jgi:hypothetical protein